MVEIIQTSNSDDLSAFLAAAYISHTYKVESTRTIVEIWDNFRKQIELKDNLNFVSGILAMGRMMDLKNEIEESRYIGMFNELKSTFLNDLKNHGHPSDLHESALITAMITSACISRTEEIETINEIINQWERINEKIVIKDDLDKVAVILTIGRINEYKYNIDNIEQIISIKQKLHDYVTKIIGTRDVVQKDFAAAFITSAYLEITPKVEKTQDIVTLWEKLQKDLKIDDSLDYITAILTYGRIRDLNAQYFLTDTSILEIKDALRNHINSKK